MSKEMNDERGLHAFSQTYPDADERFGALRDRLLDPATSFFHTNNGLRFADDQKRYDENVATVLRDDETGILVKYYGNTAMSLRNARLQFGFMNLLADGLRKNESHVHAVRHPLLIHRATGETAALMEPAPGKSVSDIISDLSIQGTEGHPMSGIEMQRKKMAIRLYRHEIDRVVRKETAAALGSRTLARLLVNDLDRQMNRMTNIFVEGEGNDRIITLIDQPYEGSYLARTAFKWLETRD